MTISLNISFLYIEIEEKDYLKIQTELTHLYQFNETKNINRMEKMNIISSSNLPNDEVPWVCSKIKH